MDFKRLLGLTGPKRIYYIGDEDVQQEEYAIAQTYIQVLFMEKGLVDTIGPTWEMIHDPRYSALENQFIEVKEGPHGGKIHIGQLLQDKDGHFSDTNAVNTDLEQIAEILDEGRNLMKRLRSNAILEANKAFAYPVPTSEWPGLDLLEKVDAEAKADLEKRADALQKEHKWLNPNQMYLWEDYQIDRLIKEDYPNWFNRKGEPNAKAKGLRALVKGDLVGLVADYCEIPKFQETMLILDEDVLYNPEEHSEENPRCSAEYLWLQRALDYRAQVRVIAARYLRQLGLDKAFGEPIDLTDEESDTLLRRLFSYSWDTPKTTIVADIMGYLLGIVVSKKTLEQRRAEQLAAASKRSKEYIAKLKSGEEKIVNRYTDGVIEPVALDEGDGQDKMYARILRNPNWGELFMLLRSLDKQYKVLNKYILRIYEEDEAWETFVKHWEDNIAEYPDTSTSDLKPTLPEGLNVTTEAEGIMESLAKVIRAQNILEQVFEKESDFDLTDDLTADYVARVTTLVPPAEITVDDGTLGGAAMTLPTMEYTA